MMFAKWSLIGTFIDWPVYVTNYPTVPDWPNTLTFWEIDRCLEIQTDLCSENGRSRDQNLLQANRG